MEPTSPPLPPRRPPQAELETPAPNNVVPLPPRRPPQSELAPTQAQNPAINSQQINTGDTNILDEIGGFLSNLFSGGMGQATQQPGYKWDALMGWIPDQGAAPAAPAAPAPAPAAPTPAKAPEPWHAPMTGAPAYSGPPVEMPNEPLPGAMGQTPRTVIPSMEFPKKDAPRPRPNIFER